MYLKTLHKYETVLKSPMVIHHVSWKIVILSKSSWWIFHLLSVKDKGGKFAKGGNLISAPLTKSSLFFVSFQRSRKATTVAKAILQKNTFGSGLWMFKDSQRIWYKIDRFEYSS